MTYDLMETRRLNHGPGFISGSWVRCLLAGTVIAGALAGCTSNAIMPGSQNWPEAGIEQYCEGDEPLTEGLAAFRKASALTVRSGGTTREKAAQQREYQDLAQCIFSAHAKKEIPQGMFLFAMTILNPDEGYRSPPKGKQLGLWLLKKAAIKGHTPAVNQSLNILKIRDIGPWLVEVAKAGNPEAQYRLGAAHMNGNYGVRRDAKAAVKWLEVSAKAGHKAAAAALGFLYAQGAPGVPQDMAKAISLLEPLIDNPPKRSPGQTTLHTVEPLMMARLYCAVSEKDKALAMFQRAYNVGDEEAKQIMARECR